MNNIYLTGTIQNIQYSHTIDGVVYNKANLIIDKSKKFEDIIILKFRAQDNIYKDGDTISIIGNVRTHNISIPNEKPKVEVYVFTYFDSSDFLDKNHFDIDGRICSIKPIKINKHGNKYIEFILANNIFTDNKKLNSYIPCVAWGDNAESISKYQVNQKLSISGKIHSHMYKKVISEEDYEYKIAHQLCISEFEVLQ